MEDIKSVWRLAMRPRFIVLERLQHRSSSCFELLVQNQLSSFPQLSTISARQNPFQRSFSRNLCITNQCRTEEETLLLQMWSWRSSTCRLWRFQRNKYCRKGGFRQNHSLRFSYFGTKHKIAACHIKNKCMVSSCRLWHHILLHEEESPPEANVNGRIEDVKIPKLNHHNGIQITSRIRSWWFHYCSNNLLWQWQRYNTYSKRICSKT